MGTADDVPVKTRLKWFNNPKGFGFVCPEDEELDAFLHITTLQRAGVSALGDGASLLCIIERGPKGAQVREVIVEKTLDPPIGRERARPGKTRPPARARARTPARGHHPHGRRREMV